MILGLTGGIASGKSLISRYFMDQGIPVVDTDMIARQVVEPGSSGLKAIEAEFGPAYIKEDGTYDRSAMGQLIFNDSHARERLNRLLHPLIREEMHRQIQEHLDRGAGLVVADVPLLFEAGFDQAVDQVMVVYVDQETQRHRLMARDQINEEEAQAKIDSQGSLEEKAKRADIVIDNRGAVETTYDQVEDWIAEQNFSW